MARSFYDDLRELSVASTFVPLEDVEATAYFALAAKKAKFPPLPMRIEHRRDHFDHWVVKVHLPGTDRCWGMGLAASEVELERTGQARLSILRCRFEVWRKELVQVLASIALKDRGLPPIEIAS